MVSKVKLLIMLLMPVCAALSFDAFADELDSRYQELINTRFLLKWDGQRYHFEDRSSELEAIIKSLSKEIQKNSDNPKLFLYRGLAERYLRNALSKTTYKDMKKFDYFSSKPYLESTSSMVDDYKRAIEMDRSKRKSDGLTYEMLAAAKNDILLPGSVNELLARRIFEILNGNVPDEAVNFYEDSYTSIYECYVDEEDFDNALRIVDEMMKKFPGQVDSLKSVREGILKRQEKVESLSGKRDPNSLSAQAITRLALGGDLSRVVTEKPKQEEVRTAKNPPSPKPVARREKTAPNSKSHEKEEPENFILILALLLIGVAVIFYIIRRPRK